MARIAVIDVMPLLYRGHFAFAGKPRTTSDGVNTSAIYSFASTVLQLKESLSPTHMLFVFDSATKTFRHEAYPAYKAGRDKIPEDIQGSIPLAAEFAKAMGLASLRVDGYEADDLMGAVSAIASRAGFETILVTPDKDIAQLVSPTVRLCRLSQNNPGILDEKDVCAGWEIESPARMVDYLALAGDASDNIPGVKGVGGKTAVRLLAEFGTLDGILAAADRGEIPGKTGERIAQSRDDALMSRFLATIKRDVPVGMDLESMSVGSPDVPALMGFLRRYELGYIAKRLGLDGIAPAEGEKTPGESLKTSGASYSAISDAGQLAAFAERATLRGVLSISFFGASADGRTARLRGIALSCAENEAFFAPVLCTEAEPVDLLFGFGAEKKETGKIPLGEARRLLNPVLSNPGIKKIGHDLKRSMEIAMRHGFAFGGECHDVMLMDFVLDAAARHGIDHLARRHLSYEMLTPASVLPGEKRADEGMIPDGLFPAYAAERADISLRLYRKLLPMVEEASLSRSLFEVEEPLVPVLLEMERSGVAVDAAVLHRLGAEISGEILRLEERIYSAAGERFNLNSPKQLGEILFSKLKLDDKAQRTATGQYVTGEETLLRYASGHPIVGDILSWRGAEKLKSTYLDKLPKCISRTDGRIHSHFSQSETETGRLSSSDPNLQNLPVRTEQGRQIRSAVVSSGSGDILLAADYSQIELRIMTALSKDASMLEAFRSGRDIHRETASKIFGVPASQVTKEQRSRCKMVNFGVIYGMSAFGLAQRLNIPRSEASSFIDEYFKLYPAVKSFMENAVAIAREKGYASTMLGRRRSLRDITSRNATLRQAAERNAINTPVQGSAADLIKIAMCKASRALGDNGLSAKLILQIHDELLFELPSDELGKTMEVVRESMTGAYDFGVPLEVELGSGRNWLEAH